MDQKDKDNLALLATVVLSLLRANGGTLFIPSNILATGDFNVDWEHSDKGLRINERKDEVLGVSPKRVVNKRKVK
jgi:hypothetical protein